jgi:hypothetical protein
MGQGWNRWNRSSSTGLVYPPLELTKAYFNEDFLGGQDTLKADGSNQFDPQQTAKIGQNNWGIFRYNTPAGIGGSSGAIADATAVMPANDGSFKNPGVVLIQAAQAEDLIVISTPSWQNEVNSGLTGYMFPAGAFWAGHAFTADFIFWFLRYEASQRIRFRLGLFGWSFDATEATLFTDDEYGGISLDFADDDDTFYQFVFNDTEGGGRQAASSTKSPPSTYSVGDKMVWCRITHATEADEVTMSVNGETPIVRPFFSNLTENMPQLTPYFSVYAGDGAGVVMFADRCDVYLPEIERYAA